MVAPVRNGSSFAGVPRTTLRHPLARFALVGLMSATAWLGAAAGRGPVAMSPQIPDAQTHILLGTWLTKSESEITIVPCETGLCGYISKIVVPAHIREKYGDDLVALEGHFTDALNKDPALRDRPIQGLQILTLVSQSAPNRLEGSIYNPENGETFEGFMEILDSDTVRLSGCVLFNLICMGEDWHRVAEETTSR